VRRFLKLPLLLVALATTVLLPALISPGQEASFKQFHQALERH